MGPAIATEILLRSGLQEEFVLLHLNTNVHTHLATLGKVSSTRVCGNLRLYVKMAFTCARHLPALVLIPISQTTLGFIKDSVFIIIGKLFRRKILLQLRGSNFGHWIEASSPITRRYITFILRSTEGIIVLGDKLRGMFADFFPPSRIFTVPNGADIAIAPSRRRDNDKISLLYLGNLQASKGIEDVIEAVSVLQKRFDVTNVEMKVVGSWFSDGIKERTLEVVLKNNLPVSFHGVAAGADKWTFLADTDIFIFTPREPEGHPWVIIEAMAASLPIISTDQGAITESVIDGVNGFIVDKQNPGQIAEKIKVLIQNEELRIRMGKESLRLYEEKFTEEAMVRNLTKCFNQVLGA